MVQADPPFPVPLGLFARPLQFEQQWGLLPQPLSLFAWRLFGFCLSLHAPTRESEWQDLTPLREGRCRRGGGWFFVVAGTGEIL